MATLWYLSRTDGAHDRRWTALLRARGHHVDVLDPSVTVGTMRHLANVVQPDGIVAGPLTDALPKAVEAAVAPVLGLCWGFDVLLELGDPDVRRRVEAAVAGAALVHVDGEALRDRVVDLGMDVECISVGAWGIDLEHFSPGPRDEGLRARAGFGSTDFVLLTTRAWEPMYAVDVVLEGFALARKEEPRLRLAWAGTGSLAASLSSRAEELGIGPVSGRLGHLDPDGLLGWLRSADAYASAARADGASLSLLEALACGLPVLVTDLPSNREWVGTNDIGTVFPQDDVEAFAAGILRTVAEPGSGERRREVVVSRGDWRRNREVFLAAVDRLLDGAA